MDIQFLMIFSQENYVWNTYNGIEGKAIPFSVMGPVILHKDDIKFPINLEIVSKVNGEIRQQKVIQNT